MKPYPSEVLALDHDDTHEGLYDLQSQVVMRRVGK